jgi:hypothetical protein
MAISATIAGDGSTTAAAAPTRKVTYGGLAGAISFVVLFIINHYMLKDNPLPAEVGGAISTIITFVVAYLVPPAASEAVVNN